MLTIDHLALIRKLHVNMSILTQQKLHTNSNNVNEACNNNKKKLDYTKFIFTNFRHARHSNHEYSTSVRNWKS